MATRMIISAIIVLGLICHGSASICCFPRQFEAFQGMMTSTVKNDRFSTKFGTFRLVFDGTNKKLYSDENIIEDGIPSRVQVIEDFPAKRKYSITGALCKSEPMSTFTDRCVPDNARLLTPATFGNNALNANIYNITSAAGANFLLTEQGNCVPIMEVSSTTGSSPSMSLVVYMNVTSSITDTSVFTPPASCQGPGPVGK